MDDEETMVAELRKASFATVTHMDLREHNNV